MIDYESLMKSNVKINSIDERGFYIVDRDGGTNYLHNDGKIRPGASGGTGFWPDYTSAKEFWNRWKL